MQTLSFAPDMQSPAGTLRQLADRLLKSCIRKPVDIDRWAAWRAGRRPLCFDMIENALLAGGRREYARAIYLEKLSELVDDDSDVPPVEDCHRLVIEADVASDRARQLALLDGRLTDDECRHLDTVLMEEQSAMEKLRERLRRVRSSFTVRTGAMQIGARTW